MNAQNLDLTVCDREPIHVPGAIQPHGLLLVVDCETLRVMHVAGDAAAWLGGKCIGATLGELLGEAVAAEARRTVDARSRGVLYAVPLVTAGAADLALHVSGSWLIVELEKAGVQDFSGALLPQLELAAANFERAVNLQQLCETVTGEFQRLTGYDRIMVYRFLDDGAGVVVAEKITREQQSFLHHHFPASDIPKQARALYVRNLVRVIPDVDYVTAPLLPSWTHDAPLDMSDAALRSVSPIHLQYLRNMGVKASASISIVKDGGLWGLIACHNGAPRAISAATRAACRALAGGLARQIKAREETAAYRERMRLRTFEDDLVALLSREGALNDAISNHLQELMRMFDADGVAVLRGGDVVIGGHCPPETEVRHLAAWSIDKAIDTVFATEMLEKLYPLAEEHRAVASGLLAITLSASEPWSVLWFRAEHQQVINWAGNPHKAPSTDDAGMLNPRASFEAWRETVRGRARRWTIPEIEAASRLRTAVIGVWQTRRIRDLNRQLLDTLDQKDLLLRQKEFLIGEVNHRVQNSLQIVSSFLGLQARESADESLRAAVEEARRRIAAVSLVHRRLYRADQLEVIDAARYVDELLNDLIAALGAEWRDHLIRDLQPIMLPTDRAVGLGLVLTELVINANKYAYGGAVGPLQVTLSEDRHLFRVVVADQGGGRQAARKGFGSRMMEVLVAQLEGTLEYEDAQPGTRAVLAAPIDKTRLK